MTAQWTGNGPRYGLSWGGYDWTLAVDAARPGLSTVDARIGPRLTLDGVSSPDRDDPSALSGASLIGYEWRWNRVEALYVPEGWHSLRVRATWTPREAGVLDLEVQLQANTVDELKAVQAHVVGTCDASLAQQVGPLLTLVDESHSYLEMSHPDDTARRVFKAPGLVRHALFGYDLERGVILRGRVRGIWLASRPDNAEMARQFNAFLSEPLPLGT